jgi:hypothetical protein
MPITLGSTEFEQHHSDARGDVLYLGVAGYTGHGRALGAYASPEGHGIEFGDGGNVIQMTLVNLKWLLDREGELKITWPDGRVRATFRQTYCPPWAECGTASPDKSCGAEALRLC